MILYSLILITWILYFVSFFYSRRIRKRKEILISSTDKYRFTRDYSTIKKYGTIVVICSFIYLFIICGILGWEFRWFYGMYIINAIIIFTLDRFLIAIDHKNTNDKILGLKTHFISVVYRTLRGIYTYGFFVLFPFSYLFMGPYIIIIPIYTCSVSMEMIIDSTRKIIFSSFDEKDFFYNKPISKQSLLERFSFEDFTSIAQRSFFRGNIIITYNTNSSSAAVYTSRLFVFKKYQQIYTGNPRDAFYSTNKDTLYFFKNIYGAEYIVKTKGRYTYHEVYQNEVPEKIILK